MKEVDLLSPEGLEKLIVDADSLRENNNLPTDFRIAMLELSVAASKATIILRKAALEHAGK
jgi:hypothetical protein